MSIVVDVNQNTQDENIYEKLKKAARDGDIERLYELIAEDPNILCHFDEVPFCETPLHIAAEKGQTHFAMELMTLKPSLASKLNVSGFSPMHLALENNHIRMVRAFVAIESSLVSIKGRGRITPLHHVARTGDAELLSEFLLTCPSSIEDLTIGCETAVHIAVKNQQLMAFKVLLGWVKRVKKEDILDWKDEDGNTAFHIAASINQTEVVKLLSRTVKVKAKNLDGKTAMDILHTHQSPSFPEARRLLHSVREKLLCRSPTTLAGYLSKKLLFIEKRNNLLGLSNLSLTRESSVNTSDRQDAILVVAILIVTATYQAGLSPPGGFWQESIDGHVAGQMTIPHNWTPHVEAHLCFNGSFKYRCVGIIPNYISDL
ncbi:PGG domain-containing protein [Hirschfeldia incana]|nr:PGG domain-containing protein [Hirschfeldia incana]